MESASVELVAAPPVPITLPDQLPRVSPEFPCSEESKEISSTPAIIPPPPAAMMATSLPSISATPLAPLLPIPPLVTTSTAPSPLIPTTSSTLSTSTTVLAKPQPNNMVTTQATPTTSATPPPPLSSSSAATSSSIAAASVASTSASSIAAASVASTSASSLASVASTSASSLASVASTSASSLPPTLLPPVATSMINSLLENLAKLSKGTMSRVSVAPTTGTSTVVAQPLPQPLQQPLQQSLQQQQENSRESPPSLHANEVMMAESDDDEADHEVEEMDTKNSLPPTDTLNTGLTSAPSTMPTPVPQPPAITTTTTPSSGGADAAVVVASGRSDSASPFGDNESFASFVAREVHETALEDERSSISKSPSPNPVAAVNLQAPSSSSSTAANNLQLQSLLLGPPRAGSSSQGIVRQFGVTANCPPAPVQLPPGAPASAFDMSSHNFPKRSKYAHRAAISAMHPYHRTRGGGANVAKTLDLMKAVLQSSFNMEIKRLCDDYLSIFMLAADNIRENTGDNVPEATLKLLVCKMLEEAHQGYVNGTWEFPTGKLPNNEKVSKPKGTPMSTKKIKTKPDKSESKYGPSKRTRKPPADRHTEKSTGWRWGMDKKRLDPVKWEPEKLTMDIDFVLGVNVNKALGHAANRGKVYYLHPELFKYACDGDDKTWLYENKFLPVHGGKAFLMIYTEVESLVRTDDFYKDNNEISVAVKKLQRFHVPQFMVDKMKNFMKSVQGYFAQEAKDAISATKS